MLSREENELLTRVGPETPMGRTMRRFWMPALLSSELAAGGPSRRLRLLGEDLIAARDAGGRVAVGNYPVRELGETVWTYLGPPEHEPPVPEFEFATLPPEHVHRMKASLHCNWAQVVEGVIDSAHSNYLHSNGIKAGVAAGSTMGADLNVTRPSNDGKPRLEVEDTPYGFRYAAIRKPLVDPETRAFVRVTLWMAPFWGMVPSAVGWGNLQAMVPIDDEHTMFYHFKYCRAEPISAADRTRHEAYSGMVLGVDIDPETWRPRQCRENNWLQDREAMRHGSWSGLGGVAVEDFAVEESMGPIFDRTKEHLGTSDAAVIRMRRLMIESARTLVADGTPPHGLREPVDYRRLVAEEAMVPIGSPWQEAFAPT